MFCLWKNSVVSNWTLCFSILYVTIGAISLNTSFLYFFAIDCCRFSSYRCCYFSSFFFLFIARIYSCVCVYLAFFRSYKSSGICQFIHLFVYERRKWDWAFQWNSLRRIERNWYENKLRLIVFFSDDFTISRCQGGTSSADETRKTEKNWFTIGQVKSRENKEDPIKRCLFRYTNTGQLCCALCNQQLTSETFWKAHINGREHKQVCDGDLREREWWVMLV